MKKLLLIGVVSIVAGSLACTPALTQVMSKKSVASRTKLCKADCLPNNYHESGVGMHGLYRAYSTFDPNLQSPEGKKQYAECVKKCLDPIQRITIQRAVWAMGLTWFGKTRKDCLECHVSGW
jgi:hypothetical protein